MDRLGYASSLRPQIAKLRPLLAALIALLFYTVTDILVWQRVFEANQLVRYADTYHAGWFVSLAGYAVIGVVIMADRWKDCVFFLVALSIGAFSGLEDVLYYLLDRRPIPAALPWLDPNPLIFETSRLGVITSVAFWMIVLAGLYVALYLRPRAAWAADLQTGIRAGPDASSNS
ncbi:MAG: hypothetical protein ACK2T0_06660 [Anaerolineales bacterium]|jgi:hypothetical protein